MGACRTLVVLSVTGVGEVATGTDLAGLVRAHASLLDGDILVVTSKVVSKAEGRVVPGDRAGALAAETDRVVARRGGTSIVRTRHGLVMAAAGVDASNTPAGTVVLLPLDPDESARGLRRGLGAEQGPNVAVLVTDTCGRAWRNGQTDIAIGAAGLAVLHDHTGLTDDYGNRLSVTAPAVADELAGAADVVMGKLGRCPFAVVRGLSGLVLERGEDGPGAAALVRPEEADMFGHGAREAVVHSLVGSAAGRRGFGAAGDAEDLVAALHAVLPGALVQVLGPDVVTVRLLGDGPTVPPPRRERELGRREARLAAVAFAFGWSVEGDGHDEADVRVTRRPTGP